MRTMPKEPQYLRAAATGRPVGVDRENNVLLGYVVAQEGPFKTDGRGEFDEKSLTQVVRLGNAARGGVKSRFTHPDLSGDGLGKFLGRARDFSLSTTVNAAGVKVKAARADLHFDPSAFDTPSGDLAGYVLTLAESDPDAISSSLVVQTDQEFRLDRDGTPVSDDEGNPLPPLWRPTAVHASDIVDTGDAVDGLLSASELTRALDAGMTPELRKVLRWDNVARLAGQLLDGTFAGQPRDVVEARCLAYLRRYLARRFGDAADPPPTPALDAVSVRLREMDLVVARLVRRGATA